MCVWTGVNSSVTLCVCVFVCALPSAGLKPQTIPSGNKKPLTRDQRLCLLSHLFAQRRIFTLRHARLALPWRRRCVCACVCAVCARALTKMSGACVSERCHLGVVFSEGRQRNAAAALSPWHLVFLDTDTCVVCVWKAEQTCIVGMKNKNPVE